MAFSANIYGIDREKFYKSLQEESDKIQGERMNQGRCYLCGGDHSKDEPRSISLTCPLCKETSNFKVMPHCPGGVSHGEKHSCEKCGKEVFLVVYYDGDVFIQKN